MVFVLLKCDRKVTQFIPNRKTPPPNFTPVQLFFLIFHPGYPIRCYPGPGCGRLFIGEAVEDAVGDVLAEPRRVVFFVGKEWRQVDLAGYFCDADGWVRHDK